MACPQDLDICRVRGDTYPFVMVVKDENGLPIDITGFSFSLTVDPSPDPTTTAANLFTLTGSIIDGPNGKVRFSLSSPQADQAPGIYYYDVKMIDTASAERTIVRGEWAFEQDVTK
jgi:hypothetical protein